MPSFDVEFEIFCSCGAGLCNQSSTSPGRRNIPFVTVEPCQQCLADAKDASYNQGRDAGYEQGYETARKEKP